MKDDALGGRCLFSYAQHHDSQCLKPAETWKTVDTNLEASEEPENPNEINPRINAIQGTFILGKQENNFCHSAHGLGHLLLGVAERLGFCVICCSE